MAFLFLLYLLFTFSRFAKHTYQHTRFCILAIYPYDLPYSCSSAAPRSLLSCAMPIGSSGPASAASTKRRSQERVRERKKDSLILKSMRLAGMISVRGSRILTVATFLSSAVAANASIPFASPAPTFDAFHPSTKSSFFPSGISGGVEPEPLSIISVAART